MSIVVKWMTLDNADATRTLKQHAFVAKIRVRKYTLEKYDGNSALCRNRFVSEDGETAQNFNELQGEPLRITECCKRCLWAFEKL